MRRTVTSRTGNPDLLDGTPTNTPFEDRWAPLLIDRAAQVAELANLLERGLLTPEEFERQRRRVLEA